MLFRSGAAVSLADHALALLALAKASASVPGLDQALQSAWAHLRGRSPSGLSARQAVTNALKGGPYIARGVVLRELEALAPRLRVCGVAPGVTLPSGPMDQAGFEQAHRLTPLQRSSTAADVAQAVRFLLESPAITGTTLLVDGGQHLMRFERDFSMM